MGSNTSIPQVQAKEAQRLCDGRCGWLCKRGLQNTSLQRRWCAIHDLHLYYFENPRCEEPLGVVNLRGAIVNRSKKVKIALEIETGALVADKGVEKRVWMFTTVGADEKGGNNLMTDQMKRDQKKKDQNNLDKWLKWLQEETAKTFTPT